MPQSACLLGRAVKEEDVYVPSALCAAVVLVGSSLTAQAQTVNASDRGWYTQLGEHLSGNDNYVVGQISSTLYRNWFVFDVPTLAAGEQYTSASLSLFNPGGVTPGYSSPDGSETYMVWDYVGDKTRLTFSHAPGDAEGQAFYSDLGSGTGYGSQSVSIADNGQFVTITLNQNALDALNASAGSTFALGGSLETLNGAADQYAFGFTGGGITSETRLNLTAAQIGAPVVPEPGPVAFGVLSSLTLCGFLLRGRRKRAAV